MSDEFNKIRVENEKLMKLEDLLGWDKARQLALDHKTRAFESILNFLNKPKPEEIEVIYEERRYEAFWYVVGNAVFEYKKKQKFLVPVENMVKEVEFLGKNYQVDPKNQMFEIEGVQLCAETYRDELMIEAKSDLPKDFIKYLRYPSRKIESTEDLVKDGVTKVVSLETRAPTLVRQILSNLVKPLKADEIIKEEIVISDLSLFFYPVYTFELFWKTKEKKALISFDGATGDISLKGSKITDSLKDVFNAEDLYELSKDIASNIIPGGGLAVMVGRKVLEMSSKKK